MQYNAIELPGTDWRGKDWKGKDRRKGERVECLNPRF